MNDSSVFVIRIIYSFSRANIFTENYSFPSSYPRRSTIKLLQITRICKTQLTSRTLSSRFNRNYNLSTRDTVERSIIHKRFKPGLQIRDTISIRVIASCSDFSD